MIYFVIFVIFIFSLNVLWYLINYMMLRIKGVKLIAKVVELKPSKLAVSSYPIVSYQYLDKKNENIMPIYTLWGTERNFEVGDEVIIYMSTAKNEECIVLSDIEIILYTLSIFFIYSIILYLLFFGD